METQYVFFEAESGFLSFGCLTQKPTLGAVLTFSIRVSVLLPCISAGKRAIFCGSCAVLPLTPLRLDQVLVADMSGVALPHTRRGLRFDCNVYVRAIDGSWIHSAQGERVVLTASSREQHWRGTVLNAFWTSQQTSLGEGVKRSTVWDASQDKEENEIIFWRHYFRVNWIPT